MTAHLQIVRVEHAPLTAVPSETVPAQRRTTGAVTHQPARSVGDGEDRQPGRCAPLPRLALIGSARSRRTWPSCTTDGAA